MKLNSEKIFFSMVEKKFCEKVIMCDQSCVVQRTSQVAFKTG